MSRYEVSFVDHDAPAEEFPRGRRLVVGTYEARNGIEAIYAALRARGVSESDLLEVWMPVGSRKYLYLFGIPFSALKLTGSRAAQPLSEHTHTTGRSAA